MLETRKYVLMNKLVETEILIRSVAEGKISRALWTDSRAIYEREKQLQVGPEMLSRPFYVVIFFRQIMIHLEIITVPSLTL